MELHPSLLYLCVRALPFLGSLKVRSFYEISSLKGLLFLRSYLILRSREKSDPDPKMATVLLHIWPLMICIALADLVLVAIGAGLLGIYVFATFPILFGLNFLVLRRFCRDLSSGDPANLEAGADQKEKEQEEHQHFIALAALNAVWLPCVVGRL